jgi:hypothetical protein
MLITEISIYGSCLHTYIYGLYSDAVNHSEHDALYGRMITE